MHTLEEIRREYDRLDRICGIDTTGIELRLSDRFVRKLGDFRYPVSGSRIRPRITISSLLLESEEEFWDTVRHEYAHAAVWLMYPGERHGHDEVWKAVCRKIGCRPRSVTRSDTVETAYQQQARYRVYCRHCGAQSYYMRAGKVVRLLLAGKQGQFRCARCRRSELAVEVLPGG